METSSKIRRILEEALGKTGFDDEDDFFELGGDSLGMVSVLHRIETDLGIYISPEDFFDGPCVSQLSMFASGV